MSDHSADAAGPITGGGGHQLAEDRLKRSLDELSMLSSRHLDLEESLVQVATLAVAAIPHADGAGLTLLEHGRPDKIVSTAVFVTEVDAIQYGLGQGPCITAAETGETVVSGSLGGDRRWSRFGAQVARLGVHSVLSLPLSTPDGVVGAMNVYAHPKHAFDERDARLGERFSGPAAIAVQNAQVLSQAKRLADQLQIALTTRAVIDRAVGIFMSRSGISEVDALERLRKLSQSEHHKLADVAQSVVEEAVRKARVRQGRPGDDPAEKPGTRDRGRPVA